uniref:Uncharacterized protein n=1 Tax=Panagrolaimus superbus TaxID=310955 RepID=A0A914Y5A6_9BILA
MIGRKLLLLTLPLILLLICPSSSNTPFRKILGSEKYAIIGVSNCSITTETFMDDNHCIHHMTNEEYRFDNSCEPFFAVLYLPVEPAASDPPRILMIIGSEKKLAYRLVDIAYPLPDKTMATFRIRTERHAYFTNTSLNPSISDVIGLVYDHFSGFLYIIYNIIEDGQSKAKIDVYFMEPDSSSQSLLNTYLYSSDVDAYFFDTEWSSDIYSKKIYYHKYEHSNDHGFSTGKVYSIPFGSLTYYLKHGIRGNLEKEFNINSTRREKVQVTNGLVYSTVANEDKIYLGSLNRKGGRVRCPFNTTRSQDFLFVITGWELCKLRDGYDANLDNCEIAISEASPQNTTEPQKPSSSGFLWAITLAIIINAVILLIILCVLCKRKDVDKYDNGMYPIANKDPNGALLTPEEIFRRRRTTSTLTEF